MSPLQAAEGFREEEVEDVACLHGLQVAHQECHRDPRVPGNW